MFVLSLFVNTYIENYSQLNVFTGNALPPSTTFSNPNYGSWMNNINFHLFSPSLKVPPWESMMVAVKKIAGGTVYLVVIIS